MEIVPATEKVDEKVASATTAAGPARPSRILPKPAVRVD